VDNWEMTLDSIEKAELEQIFLRTKSKC